VTAEQNLIIAAARLSRASPESWDEFLKAFHLYAWDLAELLVSSPPDMVHIAQGRAQGVAAVSRLLDKCRETAASMDANQSSARKE
jgi:hypothetical protein